MPKREWTEEQRQAARERFEAVRAKKGQNPPQEDVALASPAKVAGVEPSSILSTPALNPPIQQAPVQASAPVEMEDIQVFDSATDQWITKQVPKSVIGAKDLFDRGTEMRDVSDYDTTMYDQGYHYYWAARDDPKCQPRCRRVGYAPVRDSVIHAHRKGKAEGWDGEVVQLGDLVLMRVPKRMHEEQEARFEKERQQERLLPRTSKAILESGAQILPDATSYTSVQAPVDDPGAIWQAEQQAMTSQNYAQMQVDAMRRAKEREDFAGGTNQFGGFNGPMAPGIPQSPVYRNG